MATTETLQFLLPGEVDLRLDESGSLEGAVAGAEHRGVHVRELFPYSRPGRYIEVRDEERNLLGFIRDLDDLQTRVAQAIRTSLRLNHFVPLVQQIRSISGRHHMFTWKVLTDRGEAEFHIRGRRQNMEEIGGDEYMVTDTEGNRYRIPSITQLDPKSLVQLRKVL
jgi:hypothetical protein